MAMFTEQEKAELTRLINDYGIPLNSKFWAANPLCKSTFARMVRMIDGKLFCGHKTFANFLALTPLTSQLVNKRILQATKGKLGQMNLADAAKAANMSVKLLIAFVKASPKPIFIIFREFRRSISYFFPLKRKTEAITLLRAEIELASKDGRQRQRRNRLIKALETLQDKLSPGLIDCNPLPP